MSRDLFENGLRRTWTPSRVAESVRSSDSIAAVARVADRIIGFGIMRYGDDEAHLDLLGVGCAHRGQGLGRRLLDWLEKPALVAGIPAVFLEVRESNPDAQAFYERLGDRQVGRLLRYYQGRESAIRMVRKLGRGCDPGEDVLASLAATLPSSTGFTRRTYSAGCGRQSSGSCVALASRASTP
jgi:ribosomal protein S18 acetylase RimI-like enzyme